MAPGALLLLVDTFKLESAVGMVKSGQSVQAIMTIHTTITKFGNMNQNKFSIRSSMADRT
jgi:hypothetical protein